MEEYKKYFFNKLIKIIVSSKRLLRCLEYGSHFSIIQLIVPFPFVLTFFISFSDSSAVCTEHKRSSPRFTLSFTFFRYFNIRDERSIPTHLASPFPQTYHFCEIFMMLSRISQKLEKENTVVRINWKTDKERRNEATKNRKYY